MAHIGSRKHAAEIRNLYAAYGCNLESEDWKELGAGSFRVVFLHVPTNVVYKISCNEFSETSEYENMQEVRNARNLLRKCRNNDQWISAYVRIPKVSAFTFGDEVVVAMQYIAGILGYSATLAKAARESLYSLSFADMHGYNYIVDGDGTIWPVDMASPRPGHPRFTGADRRALTGLMY